MRTSNTVDDFLAESTPDRTFILEFMRTNVECEHVEQHECPAVPQVNAIQMEDLGSCLSTGRQTVPTLNPLALNSEMGQKELRKRAQQSLTDAEREEKRKFLNREYQRRFRERRLLREHQANKKHVSSLNLRSTSLQPKEQP